MVNAARFGDTLVEMGKLSEQDLEKALEFQKSSEDRLGKVLLSQQLISEEDLLFALSKQFNMSIFSREKSYFDLTVSSHLSEALAKETYSLIVGKEGAELVVGMLDPLDVNASDKLIEFFDEPFKVVLLRRSDFQDLCESIYSGKTELNTIAGELYDSILLADQTAAEEEQDENIDSAPVVRLLNTIFDTAINLGASDVHIESDEKFLRVRYRVDGVLQQHELDELKILPALVLRLKILSKLNIAETRLPQDGRFSIHVRRRVIDIRLATIPTMNGESVVMRLLDKSHNLLNLTESGIDQAERERLLQHMHKPNGIVLVTGPTGSGKTTTLYSIINELNAIDQKIITIEDPVEYNLSHISQVQVNEKIKLTFARILRTFMRLDPDVILLGEMRDEETAQIAIRASMTGHMVFSSLHTNSALATVIRLFDLGLKGYLIADSIRCIVSQRLIRLLCCKCSKKTLLRPVDNDWLLDRSLVLDIDEVQEAVGCNDCHNTGYKGRVGIFEILEFDEKIIEALRASDQEKFMEHATAQLKGRGLLEKAMRFVRSHQTNLDEVKRFTGEF
jgi:MSHA biogenesis protein MshE